MWQTRLNEKQVMIPLYLQRAQYFAERYFLFNIFEGAGVLRIRKSSKSVPVQMKTYSLVYYRSQFTKTIFYTRTCKLTVLKRKANQFPLKTYKALKRKSVRICHFQFNQL